MVPGARRARGAVAVALALVLVLVLGDPAVAGDPPAAGCVHRVRHTAAVAADIRAGDVLQHFIIDPLYTVWLLLACGVAWFARKRRFAQHALVAGSQPDGGLAAGATSGGG